MRAADIVIAIVLASASMTASADRYSDYLAPIEVRLGESDGVARAQVNAFIWKHWSTKKKSGFFQITSFTKEGERVIRQGVVGPFSDGIWRLSVTTLWQFSEPKSFSAYEIERRPLDHTAGFALVLKDKAGATLGEW